ncbi:M14 family zinc carboxypeptidase [Zooshikella ganghwensis]|uniref:carboxypeptidase T n=1 Tax=Zooshikella ganghwensis TaxID=202772 RepID=A0A4P9VNV6_9GAMM|nr:M14 family zinc carboxypeptidase [Zooshikella ganghwensis]RDH43810.1 carboxypeptidase [Zooshikella ganghwensis]
MFKSNGKSIWCVLPISWLFVEGVIAKESALWNADHEGIIDQPETIYKVFFPNELLARQAAISFHGQLLETDYKSGYMIMELTNEDKYKLKVYGFTFESAEQWVAERDRKLQAIQQQLKQRKILSERGERHVLMSGIPGYPCYQTVEETFQAAEAFTKNYPTLAEWLDVGNSWEKAAGKGGYDIKVLKLTNKNAKELKPILFANSAIHAREYTTAPLNLAFARHLLEGYGEDADATWILDHHEVHLMLMTNPDGRKKAESGHYWRKNTNQNYCGATSSNRGADLNRNFSFSWNTVSGGSSGNSCNETYRGSSPASEPEIKAIESYVRNLFPDRRGPDNDDAAPLDTMGLHLDIHSYSELVLWPWGTTRNTAPNGMQLQTLGRKFAFFNGYMPQQSIGLYPTDGTSDGISYGELGVPAFTFELGTQFFQSCSTFESKILPDNLAALIYAAKVVRAPYMIPSGPDVTSIKINNDFSAQRSSQGIPVTLSASVTDTRFSRRNGTEPTQAISAAEYYINVPPWKKGATAVPLQAVDGRFDEKTETVSGIVDTSELPVGKHMLYVRSQDADGNWGAVSAIFLPITNEPNINYCKAESINSSDEWISKVQVGQFIHTSGASHYSDFTELKTGKTIPLMLGRNEVTLTPDFAGRAYGEYWRIWIDFNRDGDFADSGEMVFDPGSSTTTTQRGVITVSSNAIIHQEENIKTRMRVVMRYKDAPSPCGRFSYGEVEDYTVEIRSK